VLLLDQELAAVEGAESRAVTEQLATRFESLVVHFGSWLPDVLPALVVIDPGALASARAKDRRSFLADLQARTRPGGVHIILSGPRGEAVIPLIWAADVAAIANSLHGVSWTGWDLPFWRLAYWFRQA